MEIPKQSELLKEFKLFLTEYNMEDVSRKQLNEFAVRHFSLDKAAIYRVFDKSNKPILKTRITNAIKALVKEGVLIDASDNNYKIQKAVVYQKPNRSPKTRGKPEAGIGKNGSPAALKWISNNQSAGVALAAALMFCYLLPVLLVFISALETSGFMEPNILLTWFSAFLNSSDSFLADFHKILFPVIAGVSIISLKDKPTRPVFMFAGAIFIAFLFSKGLHVYLNIENTINALTGLPSPPDIQLLESFFNRVEETLITYFMMLIGINISNSMRGA